PPPDAFPHGVAGACGGGDVGRRLDLQARFARALRDGRSGRVRLEATATAAALARPAVPIDGDMAELAAVSRRPAKDTAVEDDAAAHARRDGQVDHVAS